MLWEEFRKLTLTVWYLSILGSTQTNGSTSSRPSQWLVLVWVRMSLKPCQYLRTVPFKGLLLTQAALFDQKYSKNFEILLRFVLYFNILWNVIYACDQSCIFSIITPVFSVTWSSEIIIICRFAAQEILLIIISVEIGCAASYFCVNIFRILFNK